MGLTTTWSPTIRDQRLHGRVKIERNLLINKNVRLKQQQQKNDDR